MSAPAHPLVSVLLPCYNHARYVEEALESARQQTYQTIELIVVDDGSTDDSAMVIQAWMRSTRMPCTFIRRGQNGGICAALNTALRQAAGKYVAILAADDQWLPHMIETLVVRLERLPETYGVIYGDGYQIDADGQPLPKRFIETHRQFVRPPEGDIFIELARGNWIPADAVLIRRSCYERVGQYDEAMHIEDYDMWFRLARFYLFAHCPEPLAIIRILPTSLSRSRAREQRLQWQLRIWLRAVGWDRRADEFLRKKATYLAEEIYRCEFSRSTKYLWMNVYRNPSAYGAYLWLCSVLRVPFGAAYTVGTLLARGRKLVGLT